MRHTASPNVFVPEIGDQSWHTKPGAFVKVPANHEHSLTNTGDEDLVFLVIYDPPHVATD
jgi:mannose-6-phosphate isomerase-like protein (cupin superfamily)